MAKGYKTWILDRRNDVVFARVKLRGGGGAGQYG